MRLASCALVLAVTGSAYATDPGSVVFSELMWMGSFGSSSDEWIELYNRSDESIDLSGWTIARRSGEEILLMLVIPEGWIAADGTFLISNYAADDDRSRLQANPQVVDASVSLPNSKLQLYLYNGDPVSARLVDVADDGKGAPWEETTNSSVRWSGCDSTRTVAIRRVGKRPKRRLAGTRTAASLAPRESHRPQPLRPQPSPTRPRRLKRWPGPA